MIRGGRFLAATALLGMASCGGETGKLELRSTPSPLSAGSKPVLFRVAEGQAQLALGNAGLALESFRKALRDDPNSTDAMVGIAFCYDRMGRYDLSRRHYEAALAISPNDPQLLAALAESLDRQGKRAEAADVRTEIAARMTSEAAQPLQAEPATVQAVAIAVAEPAPERPHAAEPRTDVADTVPLARLPTPLVGKSITVSLPPATPSPAEARKPQVSAPVMARAAAPRLERMSMGEVALVTTSRPLWTAIQLHREARVDKVRFVPLRQSETPAVASIRLLNAARHEGLAARTRSYLTQLGWRGLAIGDAPETRERSLVIYPAERRRTGLSLAAQFGFEAVPSAKGHNITVLLGRDAVDLTRRRADG